MIASLFLPVFGSVEADFIPPAQAQSTTDPCVQANDYYNSTQQPERSKRPISSSEFKLLNKSNDNSLWTNEPVEISFRIVYTKNSQWRDTGCQANVTPKLKLQYEGIGSTILGGTNVLKSPGYITADASDLVFNSNNGLQITGKFKINKIDDVLTDEYRRYVNAGTYKDYVFKLDLLEYADFNVNKSPVKLSKCNDPSGVCVAHTPENFNINNTVGVGEANQIALSTLKFNFNSLVDKASSSQYLPADTKDKPYQNFVRLYEEKGVIKGFTLTGQVDLAAPTDRNLSISDDGNASLISMSNNKNSSYAPKPANGLGVGVAASKKVITAKDSGYGCVKSSTSTNYVVGTGNESYSFNSCRFATNAISKKLVLEPNKPGHSFNVNIDADILKKLGASTEVECKDDSGKVDPKGTKCTETVNSFDFYQAIGLDRNLFSDTSLWAWLTSSPIPSIFNSGDVTVSYNPPIAFYVQIYPSKEAWQANIDKPIPASVPAYAGVTTESSSDQQNTTASLFDFLRRVISYIVLILTSTLYWVFAYILVPVIIALIKVHPYKDEFVNFVYPGWIIVRNISNIAFIIALLYMGMKILFQQEDASKSRGFIITLILMALLVNFSLVIGQGIIAIADTVQSQFLPEDSKVIETLGHKLMVDPILTFRGNTSIKDGLADNSGGGEFTADTVASDLPKAIVLLVLAIAAFFSFVALVAFLFVRIVVLWILYMMSPLAYVGRILPETKSYASQWWQEFMKYAFSVPIMAFFLNIAALVAVTFSGQSGDQVNIQSGQAFLWGNLPEGLAAFALTTASHFIVLVFIFIGMKYSLQFGGAGAKQIVAAAKGGFDYITKTIPKEYAQNKYIRHVEGGLLDPMAWKQGWKDSIQDKNKSKKTARLLRKADRLDPNTIFKHPGKSAKYLLNKLAFRSPRAYWKNAEEKKRESDILTDTERAQAEDTEARLDAHLKSFNGINKLLKPNKDGKITTANGQAAITSIASEKTRLTAEARPIMVRLATEEADLRNAGDIDAANAKRAEATAFAQDYTDKLKKLNSIRDKITPNITAAVTSGATELAMSQSSQDSLAQAIAKAIKDVEGKRKQEETRITKDDGLRKEYGYKSGQFMTDLRRNQLREIAEKLQSEGDKRKLPESLKIKALRIEAENEQAKKYEGVDDPEEQIKIFEKALSTNNMPLASAMAKALAKSGSFKDLLQEEGYRNNGKSAQSFFADKFKNMSPNLRLQLMAEVGYLNGQNGNLAASKLTKVDSVTGTLREATAIEQKAKINGFLGGRTPTEARSLKPDQISEEKENGRYELFSDYIDVINRHVKTLNRGKQRNDYIKGFSVKVAKHAVKADNFGKLDPEVRSHFIAKAK